MGTIVPGGGISGSPGAGAVPGVAGKVSCGATIVSRETAVSCLAAESRAVVSRAVVSRAVVSRAVVVSRTVVSRLVVESCAIIGVEPSISATTIAAEKRKLVIPVLPAIPDTKFHYGFFLPVSDLAGAGGGPSGTSDGGRFLARTESCFAFSLFA